MHPGGELLRLGDPTQQSGQGDTFLRVEAGAERLLVGECRLGEPAHRLLALGREVEVLEPAVLGVAAALDQSAFLDGVDEGHEPARRHAEPPGEFLLVLAGGQADRPEQARLGRGEIQLGDPPGEGLRGVLTQLGQQKCDLGSLRSRMGRRGAVGRFGHGNTIPVDNDVPE